MALKSSKIGSHFKSLQLTFLRLFGASAIVRLNANITTVGIKHNHIVLVYKRKHTNLWEGRKCQLLLKEIVWFRGEKYN